MPSWTTRAAGPAVNDIDASALESIMLSLYRVGSRGVPLRTTDSDSICQSSLWDSSMPG